MFALTPSPITGDNYPALADNYPPLADNYPGSIQ